MVVLKVHREMFELKVCGGWLKLCLQKKSCVLPVLRCGQITGFS